MPPATGAALTIEIETAGPVWTVISDMDTFESASARSETEHIVFQRADAYVIEGPKKDTMVLSGLLTPADVGQSWMIGNYQQNLPVLLRIKQDGTNGWTQSFYIREQRRPVRPDGFQGIAWTLSAAGAKTVVGSGVLA